jgi:hypothetical protein
MTDKLTQDFMVVMVTLVVMVTPYFSIIQGFTTSKEVVNDSGTDTQRPGVSNVKTTRTRENTGRSKGMKGKEAFESHPCKRRKWSINKDSSDELTSQDKKIGHSKSRLKRKKRSISEEKLEKGEHTPNNDSRTSRRPGSETHLSKSPASERTGLSKKEARAKRFGAMSESSPTTVKHNYHLSMSLYPCNAMIPVDRNTPNWMNTHLNYSTLASKSQSKILLVGDSMVKGLARYPRVWRTYFAGLGALNFGIGGDRTQHVLWRLQNGELECTPEIIVLHCGTNNVNQDPAEDIVRGMLVIVEFMSTKSPDSSVIVTGLLPRDLYPSYRRTKITKVNSILEEVIDLSDDPKYNQVYFLTPEDDWISENGTIDETLYHTDHLHLIEAGDDKFSRSIVSLVNKVRHMGGKKKDASALADLKVTDKVAINIVLILFLLSVVIYMISG